MATGYNCGLYWRGWLFKKSSFFGIWHRCFCELQFNEFYIRKNNFSLQPVQTIILDKTVKIELINHRKYVGFSICLNSDFLLFKSNNEEEILQWVVALKSSICNCSSSISITNFKAISVIGRGFFGKVSLYQEKKTKNLFAIKSIHKAPLMMDHHTDIILGEINIMKGLYHSPFVVDLKFAFQSATKFYIGMEYLPGGDLLTLLSNTPNLLTMFDIKLILAQLCLALHHLHMQNLIYRDLKPENVLFRNDGYVKLIDFGLAKILEPDNQTTSTFCGTPEFVAPEMVKREKYTYSVDWWSFGILAYEMLYKKTPFFDENLNKIYGRILTSSVTYPLNADPTAVSFIEMLLAKNPERRGGYEEIISHEFFNEIDFEKVMKREYKPDFVPTLDRPTDTRYFDRMFTSERAYDSFASPVFGCSAMFADFNFDGISTPSEMIMQ
ncbi:RAC family serine/threonine-protein kinase like protein [Tritrichomonas foetus]|uniref:RAC family serine/threonine-protein kinase like protein n=1 Tax=Tritrichomonas foetus TaxID=1144522 RepID=A0A1J4JCD1_9EUKA|nr:RAC family serine/threonine-protein kinase like protein [Tritrichomonas foetus]|eukprot:OHS95069.1 RAC family serine/threonine-protein kinase like protein [Tritrichomonas foetus]